ncbi:MAG: multicopper oxidase domain-containing protein [Archangium sp.]|nr:multicopper oxidase domain-containing protein [Archangium sp.]MDP3154816.1 multicopper oxidase domain-containing protein [Archangium sp.]MDP3575048.1 multicopper oxidase domain-containing protein [Archangium sp.]
MRIALLILALAGCGQGKTEPRKYPPTGQTKTFNLTARDVEWTVGPGAVYLAWTYDGTVPGPQLDVTAGDTVVINLSNESNHPVSIHTHLVEFEQAQDGVEPSSWAQPGQTVTVTWKTSYAGAVPYHDHADEGLGVGRGLIGALVIHAPDEVKANEHVVVLTDLLPEYFKTLPGVADPITGEFPDAGTYRGAHQYLHTINGKAYEESVPHFTGTVGELSRWRILSIGQEVHTWHLHGHRWVDGDGQLTDNIQLAPGMYRTFEFTEDAVGDWLVHCHVPNHMEGGMMARYRVVPR